MKDRFFAALLKVRLFALFACSLVPAALPAAVSHDAGLDWKVLVTPHFRIHYHDGLKQLAGKTAAIAEHVHDKYSKILNWQPEERTNIILTDEIGLANGWATPVPDNREAIYVTPPTDANTLEDHAGWLETVITHEYVHTLHLDKASGFPLATRKVLGRWPLFLPFSVFPNAFQPRWLTEGIATYYETDKDRGIGRGQSSMFSMMMRMEVEQGIKPYRQVNQYTTQWPSGTIPYLYGVHFYDFLVETKGDRGIINLVEDYSNDGIPFRLNANMKGVFGKDITYVWRDFENYLNNRYRPQIKTLKDSGLVEGRRLTEHGYDTGSSRVMNGDVYYIRSDNMRRPSLMVLRKGSNTPKHLTDIHFSASFDVHNKAGIVLAQPEFCGNAKLYYDLYKVNPKSGWTSRLTRCGQYHAASWSPDGKTIMAARIHHGKSSLVKLNHEGEKPEVLWQATDDTVLGQLDWSPDGGRIVVSVWRPENGWDLEEFILASKSWKRITSKSVIELAPSYTTDGKGLLFSADYDGIYNLYRLENGKLDRLTNVIGGAFSPVMDDTGSTVYYTGYHAGGNDIYRLDTAGAAIKSTAAKTGASAIVRKDWPEVKEKYTEDYSPWRSLRPRWWLPELYFSDQEAVLGVTTSGTDVLNRHIYAAAIYYDAENDWPLGSLDYVYDRWWPVLKYHASRFNDTSVNDDSEIVRVQREDTYQLEFVFPWLSIDRSINTHIGAQRVRESDGYVDTRAGYLERPDVEDRLAGIAFVYNSSRWFSRGISRNQGRQVHVIAESSDMIEGGDYTGGIYTLDWREYWPLWGEHVLALRIAGAKSTGQPRLFELGDAFSAAGIPPVLGSTLASSPFGRRHYALRGYEDGLPWLEGRHFRLGTVEYRFPVSRIERGITIPPIGIRQIHGALFVDYGASWNTDDPETEVYYTSDGTRLSRDKYYAGAGIEITFELMAFYDYAFDLKLGYAEGQHHGGDDEVYLGLAASF